MASSIPAARTWLYDQLLALTADPLAGVLIVRTGSWDNDSQNLERIVVQNATGIERDWVFVGRRILDETYTVPIYIETIQHGGNVEAAEGRLWDLVATVETMVLANYLMDGLLVEPAKPVAVSDEESGSLTNSDMTARFTLGVVCHARPGLT